MTIKFQRRIFAEYLDGMCYTPWGRYWYSIDYHPTADIHTWIIRKPCDGGPWIWLQPLDPEITEFLNNIPIVEV